LPQSWSNWSKAESEFYVDGEVRAAVTRGYNANHGPHVWTKYGPALTAPIGAIRWASTDTATYWSAYMEGAVDAGERAAQEVIRELVN
jgi:monoamine oxidase